MAEPSDPADATVPAEARDFVASVLDSVSDVLMVCGPNGHVVQVNRAACALIGAEEAEILGHSLPELLAPGYCCGQHAACPCPQPDGVRDKEVRFLRRDGSESEPVAVNCSTRVDGQGEEVGVVLIGRPVGELRQAYEALNQAHRNLQDAQQQLVQSAKMASIGRLVAGVAHELNNPTSFVYGNVHALEGYGERLGRFLKAASGGAAPGDLVRLGEELRIDGIMQDLPSLIEGTKEGAERIRDIIRSLKRLSLVGDPSEHAPFDLARAVVSAVNWSIKGRKASIEPVLDLPDDLWVRGSEGHIQQVAVNLVDNALDALDGAARRRLEVTGRREDGTVILTVRDTGPGIGDDDLDRVFDPFFTTKPVGEGTGLGLWICYDIVKGHGGGIEAANHPDGGALVTVTLPAAEREA